MLAVVAFALSWWLGCYLLARDPTRPLLRRAAAALLAYAGAVACALLGPHVPALPLAAVEQVLLCAAPLAWAGAVAALLGDELPEHRQIVRGWLLTSGLLLVMVPALPPPGRLVALAPLAGALVLLWRFRDGVHPPAVLVPVTVAAVLYGGTLAAVLVPVDLGAPVLVRASLGLDLLVLGLLAAVADAEDSGERWRPDLRRSLLAAVGAGLLAGGPTALALAAADPSPVLVALQLVVVAGAVAVVPVAGPAGRLLDRIAFHDNPGLRAERETLLLTAEALPRRRDRRIIAAGYEEQFVRLVHRALRHYGDLGRLLRSPLIDLPVLERRLAARGMLAPPPVVRAAELRALLREAVQRLKPTGAFFGTTDDWRYYNALFFCCVLGLRPYRRGLPVDRLDSDARRAVEWFRTQVPERRLRHWQQVATRMVARDLWAAMQQREQPAPVPPRRPV